MARSLPEKGKELFALACASDLEGIVGKWNPSYSQAEGRSEFFENRARVPGTRPPELQLA